MRQIMVGDRVLIVGEHPHARKEGNVAYITSSFGKRWVMVHLECGGGGLVSQGDGAWLVKLDGPVVIPLRALLVWGAINPLAPFPHDRYRVGATVTVPPELGKWAGFRGVVKHKTEDGYLLDLLTVGT